MPTTVLELILFAATFSPGFVFLSRAERRRPERTQTTLRETAELFVVGSTATLTSLIIVTTFFEVTGLGSVSDLLFRTATYVEHHLLGLIFAVVAVYGIACGLAALAADRVYGRTLNLNQSSAWFDGFRTDLPEGGENSVVVTMKSKEVHRGWVFHYTADNGPIADRELVLTTEGNLDRFPGQHAADGKAQVILHGDAIESIELLYVPKPPSPQAGS